MTFEEFEAARLLIAEETFGPMLRASQRAEDEKVSRLRKAAS